MLWVKRTVSMTYVKNDGYENIYSFTQKKIV